MVDNKVDSIVTSAVFDAYSFLSYKEDAKALFVLFDAGETKALEAVMQEMDDANIPYKILAFGTSWNLMKQHRNIVDIYSCISMPQGLNGTSWDRLHGIHSALIQEIYAATPAEIVISGMVSEIQKQLTEFYKKKGAEVFLYYDSFSPISTHAFTMEMLWSASLVLVPSMSIAESVHALVPDIKVDVVGQPTLEHWVSEISRLDSKLVKETISIHDQKPFLVYISGYGSGYEEAFRSFVEAIQYVDHFQIGISLHPKMDGSLERQMLDAYNCQHVFVIPKNVQTSHVVSVADLVVTWRSTVGVQAAILGKPVIYLDQSMSTFECLAIDKGWAMRCTNAADLLHLLIYFEVENIPLQERFAEGGIPQESAKLIFKKIIRKKDRSFVPRKPLKPEISFIFSKIFTI